MGDEGPKAGSGPVDPNAAELAKVREGDEIVAADGIDVRDNPGHIYAGNEGYLKLYNHVQETNGAPVKLTLENVKSQGAAARGDHVDARGWSRGRSAKGNAGGDGTGAAVGAGGSQGRWSPAAAAGIKEGDIVLQVGDRTNPTAEQFIDAVASNPGRTM